MKALAVLALLSVIGGCAPQPSPLPPIPGPEPGERLLVHRIEGDFVIAERILPQTISVGETFEVRLRVTAKRKLEYILWREVIGGYATEAVYTDEDLEFMSIQVPQGALLEWKYHLRATSDGKETIDGVIKSVVGPYSENLRLKNIIEVMPRGQNTFDGGGEGLVEET